MIARNPRNPDAVADTADVFQTNFETMEEARGLSAKGKPAV
jgi:hypothetical protein